LNVDSLTLELLNIERGWLHRAATRSADATRREPEDESPVRLAFQRDRDRVTHSKAFRRLMNKTQMFAAPGGDHFRTRLTHTLEVTQIARTIARALHLNEDLVEAIGLAHDLGHTPFGHAGERALAEVFPGFHHSRQSLRVVDRIERDGRGLNLTDQVRDGIIYHSKPAGEITGEVFGRPQAPEAQIVKISDAIAYINHDLDDALRGGMIDITDVPNAAVGTLGATHSERIDTLVTDIIGASRPLLDAFEAGAQVIEMSASVRDAADLLRDFLFERVYNPINRQPSTLKAQRIVQILFEDARDHPDTIPVEFGRALASEPVERVAADYVAGMTDRYAIARFEERYVPKFWW
jgi:dGTPase